MGLSSNCCHSNIGSVSSEQHSVGAKVSDIEPTPSPPSAHSLSRPPWHEAVVRKQGGDTPQRRRGVTTGQRRGVAAGQRRARRRRDSKDSEAQRRAHPPSRPAGRPRRRHSARRNSARRHRRHERACSNQQHSRATTTRSRPNTAQSDPRTIWCALSRRGASEGRIGAVVVRVGN